MIYIWKKFPREIIKEDDVTQLLLQENLLTIFEDIFTKNNPYDERIQVVYQPILDLDTNKFKTMEALTRLYVDGKTISCTTKELLEMRRAPQVAWGARVYL